MTESKTAACDWVNTDLDHGIWHTDCGSDFSIEDGTPKNNGMKFCCYCGRSLHECLPPDDEFGEVKND